MVRNASELSYDEADLLVDQILQRIFERLALTHDPMRERVFTYGSEMCDVIFSNFPQLQEPPDPSPDCPF